jgi:ABC-2 type transport system permease protein
VRLYLHQLRTEQLLFWRSREAAVFIFLFPIMFYVLLGAVYDGTYNGHSAPTVLLVGLLGYAAANTAFAGVALQLVFRREIRVLKRLRATPLPAPTLVAAYLTSTMIVFTLQSIVLVSIGHFAYGAEAPDTVLGLVAALAVGAVCFGALGVATASLIHSVEGSSAVVNLILLPMGFLSGSFIPRGQYPDWVQDAGRALPLGQLLDLVSAAYYGTSLPIWALLVLLAWGAVGLVVAARRFRWEPREG